MPGLIVKGNYLLTTEIAKEAILYDAYRKPELTAFHTIYEDIVAAKQIPFLGLLDKITKLDLGCGLGIGTGTVPLSQKEWAPSKLKAWLQQCADDLEDTFFVYGLKKGIARKDLTGTDFLDFMQDRVQDALLSDALRIAWFGDKAIAAAALTGGAADVPNYNQVDGFWKQIFANLTANAGRRVTIAENAAGTIAAQEALAVDRAATVFDALKYNASIDTRLRSNSEGVILATQSLVNNYRRYLRNPTLFSGVPQAYERIEGGYGQLEFDGTPVITVDFWDRYIRSDFAIGTTYDRPHRAVYTTKANLAIGVDGQTEMTQLDVFYDPVTELNNVKAGYKMQPLLLVDHMVAAAY